VISVGVVGAGVIGELTARALAMRGCAVTLFDRGANQRASAVAAGLLSPFSGRELPEPEIFALAKDALPRWRALAHDVVPFSDAGTLVVAPVGDEPLLDELLRGLRRRGLEVDALNGDALRALAPELGGRALYLPREGWIDAQAALACLQRTPGVERALADATPRAHAVIVGERTIPFDWVVDCRGLHACTDVPSLRGVRGELLVVEAPEVALTHAVRILSPRTPIYIVPRPPRGYVIGATLLECEDRGSISVRATLELLAAACAIHPGFADAKIVRSAVGLRPALPDNLPLFAVEDGLVRINGAYRHGFVVGPALAARAADVIAQGRAAERACASS
jgi:glycine oxidase